MLFRVGYMLFRWVVLIFSRVIYFSVGLYAVLGVTIYGREIS